MNKEANIIKRCCKAMLDAGIEDPESAEGIVFCTGNRETESRCPYPVCVVFEHRGGSWLAADERKRIAWELYDHGVSKEDIALILGKHFRTVQRYLRRSPN